MAERQHMIGGAANVGLMLAMTVRLVSGGRFGRLNGTFLVNSVEKVGFGGGDVSS